MEKTIAALATALEKRDPYTAGHQYRVSELASVISEAMNDMDSQKRIFFWRQEFFLSLMFWKQ